MKKVGFIDYFLDEWHAITSGDDQDATAGEMIVTCLWHYDVQKRDNKTGVVKWV